MVQFPPPPNAFGTVIADPADEFRRWAWHTSEWTYPELLDLFPPVDGEAMHNVFTPEQFGAEGNNPAHDDAPGFEAALEAAVNAALADESYICVVQLAAKTYYFNRAPRLYKQSFAQVAFPDSAYYGVYLAIRGVNPTVGVAWGAAHWPANPRPVTKIISNGSGAFSTTNGVPSIVGGSSLWTNSAAFTDSLLTSGKKIWLFMENISIEAPAAPAISGLWCEQLFGCFLSNCRIGTREPWGQENPANHACGVVMPMNGNMHQNILNGVHIQGWYCGLVYSEHTSGDQSLISECTVCMVPDLVQSMNSTPLAPNLQGMVTHSACFNYLCLQTSRYYFGGWHPQSGVQSPWGCVPTVINLLNVEDSDRVITHVLDANNRLRITGNVSIFRGTSPWGRISNLRYNGGAGVNLNFITERFGEMGTIDWSRPNIGPQAAPAMPSSGTELQNPFGRNAQVSITGVGGGSPSIQLRSGNTVARTQVGTASWSGVVPANGHLTLTYSGTAPTWAWTLF